MNNTDPLKMAIEAIQQRLREEENYIPKHDDTQMDDFRSGLRNGLRVAVGIVSALTASAAAKGEQFCFCNDDISLQIVSGGASVHGLYGEITLKVGGEYVTYRKVQQETKLELSSEFLAYMNALMRSGDSAVKQAVHTILDWYQGVDVATPPQAEAQSKECQHENGSPDWDYYGCHDCGWVKPSGQIRGPNNGWFPSMDAVREYDKFKTYPGMNEVKPMSRWGEGQDGDGRKG